ncbi:MAG: transposase family protein [Bacteroides sp.]|nr:transposase family protein [Bacteroides sp.]
MDFYAKSKQLSNQDFKQIIGVERTTFDAMVTILNEAYASKLKKWRGRRKKKLTTENQLIMTLKYLRQYVTQKELAFEFEIGEATVCDTIRWIEDTLVKDGSFSLPGKKGAA